MNDTEPLTGRRFRLRPLLPYDYDALYVWATMPPTSTTWRFRGQQPSPESFATLLWTGALTQFAVVARDEPDAICGLVQAFNHDPGNRFAYLSVVVGPAHQQRTTAAGEAIVLLLGHLFDAFDLRKVYIETTETATAGVLRMAKSWPCVSIEGVLTQNQFHDGRFVDTLILAVDRGRFFEHREGLTRLIEQSSGLSPVSVAFEQFVNDLPPELIAHSAQLGSVTGGTLLAEELGVDSLGLIELVAWIEDRFDVTVPDADVGELRTAQDLFALYETALQESRPVAGVQREGR